MENTMQKFIERCKSDDFDMYITNEFYNLKDYSSDLIKKDLAISNYGALDCNHLKNRYKDILPFDKYRVVLDRIDNIEGSDYINASFIQGVEGSYSYIGAQAPLKSTISDFIRMIWEYNIAVIICACNEFEANKPKCYRYWPNDTNETLNFDKIEAKLIEIIVDSTNEFIIREILLKRTNIVDGTEFIDERIITQFHYVNWPDHGVPDDFDPIIKMMDYAREKLNESMRDKKQYLLVHCSAGCGRTGTIIALDYCQNLISFSRLTNEFSAFKIGKMLREQRTAMIQTYDQYKLFNEALAFLFKNYLTNKINVNNLKPVNNNNNDNQYQNIENNNNNNNNNNNINQIIEQRIHSSGSIKGSFKKVLDKIRPGSSVSSKSQSNKISSATSTKSRKLSNSGIIKLDNDNLTDKIKNECMINNSYYDNSFDDFEFKPIPSEKFNNNINLNDKLLNIDVLTNYVIDDYDDDDENLKVENHENDDEDDKNLVGKSVGGVADSIFGKKDLNNNNIDINSKKLIRRNNSFNQFTLNNDTISNDNERSKQSMSASYILAGSIQKFTPVYTDLKKLNPPKKAQISTNLNNPSPPVSARSTFNNKNDLKTNEPIEIIINQIAFSPTPPPRIKQKNKNSHVENNNEYTPIINKNDLNPVNNGNNTENTNYRNLYDKSNNGNTQFISETEHYV